MRRLAWTSRGQATWVAVAIWVFLPVTATAQSPDGGDAAYSVEFGNAPATPAAASAPASDSTTVSSAVSGNPAATNIVTGSGRLGDVLGVNQNGIRLGGINISDANGLLSGGVNPGQWTGASLTIVDLSINTEELLGWKGGLFGTQMLYYGGGNVNSNAGTVMGYDSLDVVAPRTRVELYELWYRQELFNKKLVVRLGKSVPTYDFNNVLRAVPLASEAANIPSVSSALFTPAYISPTMLGIMPGYYNSATGLVATLLPYKGFYVQYGLFDGNVANNRQTGLEGPNFNGYDLNLAEVGTSWKIGEQEKPGKFGAGYWRQTGTLQGFSGPVRGAEGAYFFGSQRLYYQQPGINANGLSTFYSFGGTDSEVVATHRFLGWGLTYFGPIPRRTADSVGFGLAYGKMTNDPNAGIIFNGIAPKGTVPLAKDETILTWYYQMKVADGFLVQPNLSYIPTPAAAPGIPGAFAITLRGILLF